MYGLTPADLDLQRRARDFTDELIGLELDAEEHDGRLPDEVVKAHHDRAIALGLHATNMPVSVGGPGCSTLQQVLVQEQAGRVTNGIAWCLHTPPSWWPEVANEHQRDTWLLPTVRGEMQECYAITEEGAGSDVADLTATAARDGDDYVLDGVKWHVTSFHEARYVFFQAVLSTGVHAGDQALFVVDTQAPGVRVVRTPSYTHTLGHRHPVVAFEGVRVPATHLVGSEEDGMSFRQFTNPISSTAPALERAPGRSSSTGNAGWAPIVARVTPRCRSRCSPDGGTRPATPESPSPHHRGTRPSSP